MNERERAALEAAGFRIGDAEDFLELTDEERHLVELRVALSRAVRARREAQGLTQGEVAKRLKTSQPRVAMIESAARAVSLDAMFRGLFVLGGNVKDLLVGDSASPTKRRTPTQPRPSPFTLEGAKTKSPKLKAASRPTVTKRKVTAIARPGQYFLVGKQTGAYRAAGSPGAAGAKKPPSKRKGGGK